MAEGTPTRRRRTRPLLISGIQPAGSVETPSVETLRSSWVVTRQRLGIGVDESGHLIAVLAWCGPAPDGVTLFHERATPQGSPAGNRDDSYVDDATYHAPPLSGQSSSFRLDAPGGGWTVTPAPPVLDPAITYMAYGFTVDNTSALRRVTFRIDEAAKVEPGQVLIQDGDENRRQDAGVVVPLDAFRRMAQDPANCP